MKKILFIINPISGIGRQKIVEELIEKKLDKVSFDPHITYTNAPKHAIEISKKAADNFDIVVAVGGDGSVNEVAKGLINSNTALAILPAGSGNGLARYLNIPTKINLAIKTINDHNIKLIDTISINDELSVNVAGIGFDAHIAHLFSTYGKRGFFSYIKIILRELKRFKELDCTFNINDKSFTKKVFLVSFANSSQWGNNGYIAPLAEIDDGLIDICIVRRFPTISYPVFAFRLLNKSLHKSKYVEVLKASSLKVSCKDNIIAHYDGEPSTFNDTLNIKIIPSSLRIVVPK